MMCITRCPPAGSPRARLAPLIPDERYASERPSISRRGGRRNAAAVGATRGTVSRIGTAGTDRSHHDRAVPDSQTERLPHFGRLPFWGLAFQPATNELLLFGCELLVLGEMDQCHALRPDDGWISFNSLLSLWCVSTDSLLPNCRRELRFTHTVKGNIFPPTPQIGC